MRERILTITKASTITLALLAGGWAANAQVVVVSPGNMQGWSFVATDDNGALATSSPYTDNVGQMVNGPATPPLGSGSAELSTTADGGNGASRISTGLYDGLLLSSITSLSYSTYDTINNGQQFPFMEIAISTDGSGSAASEDSLFFEPPYQTPTTGNPSLPNQGAAVMNTWQTWNVLTGGLWDNNGNYNPGTSEPGSPGVDSLAAFLAIYPDATIMDNIVNGGAGNEGITLLVGEDGSANTGYVDNVTIGTAAGTTTYDFEPTPVPEPTTLALAGLGMGTLFLYRRKK